jgi:hypothetical protein
MVAEVRFLKVNGTEFTRVTNEPLLANIKRVIDAEILDTVNLRDGTVMLLDDNGIRTKPVNPAATEIYRSIYPRARSAGRNIHGDVAIAKDSDFA